MFPEVRPGHRIAGAPVTFHFFEGGQDKTDIDIMERGVDYSFYGRTGFGIFWEHFGILWCFLGFFQYYWNIGLSFRELYTAVFRTNLPLAMVRFTMHIVKQEMSTLMEGQNAFRPSDVAIVFGDMGIVNVDLLQNAIGGMLKQEYNLETTTIRGHVMNDNTDKVVLGTIEDFMSYEAPCVIYIGTRTISICNMNIMYSLLSRARTRLSLIITNKFSSNLLLQVLSRHCTRVMWVEKNGHFVKK